MITKEQLHQLVDALPESALPAVERFFKSCYKKQDPLLWKLVMAPEDDEPETPEERAAVDAAKACFAAGAPGIPHEEARRVLLEEPGAD